MPYLKLRAYNSLFGKEHLRLSFVAIFIGALVKVVSSFLLATPLLLLVLLQVHQSHLSVVQRRAAMVAARGTLSMLSAEWLIVVACSVLGGYIAAKVAKHDEILNGGCSSILSLMLGLYFMVSGKNIHPMWLQVVHLVSAVVFACLGGYLRIRQVRGRTVSGN